jgi:hypothetical protein
VVMVMVMLVDRASSSRRRPVPSKDVSSGTVRDTTTRER